MFKKMIKRMQDKYNGDMLNLIVDFACVVTIFNIVIFGFIFDFENAFNISLGIYFYMTIFMTIFSNSIKSYIERKSKE